jgi:hypothetical protein
VSRNLPHLTIDADIMEGCARHTVDVDSRAKHAGITRIRIDLRTGLFTLIPGVAAGADNAVIKSVE